MVDKVENMHGMFAHAPSFNVDLSSWNIEKLKTMAIMFYKATSFNRLLCGDTWIEYATNSNPQKIANPQSGMFDSAGSNAKIGTASDLCSCKRGTYLNTGSCNTCPTATYQDEQGFQGTSCKSCSAGSFINSDKSACIVFFAPADRDTLKTAVDDCISETPDGSCPIFSNVNGVIGEWDVSNVKSLEAMFKDQSEYNADISKWQVGAVTCMRQTFHGATKFNSKLGNWNVAETLDMYFMFYKCKTFSQDISKWQVSKVSRMDAMFADGCHKFNSDLARWDTGKVTIMSYMFKDARQFDRDIGTWDVRKLTNMYHMFQEAHLFSRDLSSWNIRK